MADPERTMLVLFGSETGNAQDMAEDLGRICQRLHFKTRVEELDAIELVCGIPPNSFAGPQCPLEPRRFVLHN